MKRSGPIPRRTPMPRPTKPIERAPMRPKRRSAAEKAVKLEREYGGERRLSWIASLPCSVPMCPRGPSENAHTRTGGMSRKADAETIIPLCTVHHRELHSAGQHTFARLHGLDLTRTAERIANAWRALHPMTAVGEVLPAVLPDLPTTRDRQREAGD